MLRLPAWPAGRMTHKSRRMNALHAYRLLADWSPNGVTDLTSHLFCSCCGCECPLGKMAFVEGRAVTGGRRRNCPFTVNYEIVHLVAMRYRLDQSTSTCSQVLPRRKRPPGQPHDAARPGVIINWCSSVLESQAAVACSEVPAFRYESALGQVERETAERGTSAHCLSSTARPPSPAGVGFGGAQAIRRHRTRHRPGIHCRPRRCSPHRRPDWEARR